MSASIPPYRVCHLSYSLCTGGIERLLVEFARWHDRQLFAPTFVAIAEVGAPAEAIRELGWPVHLLTATGRFGRMRELYRLLRAGQIDLLHTHNLMPHVVGPLPARLAGVRAVIQTIHGQSLEISPLTRLQWRLMARFTDRLVAISDDAAALWRELHGIRQPILRIWNGIDTQRLQYAGPGPATVAVSVGRLSTVKDYPGLLRAMALARQEVPELRLVLVGDGPEREELHRLRQELNLVDAVELPGEQTDVAAWLSRGAFFVCSSVTEGLSLAILEAMACGLPVIATRVGGNAELVVDGETGLVVPPGDPAALAAAMVRLSRDPALGAAMGQRGRARAEAHFEIRQMMRHYEQLYREVLPPRPRAADTANP